MPLCDSMPKQSRRSSSLQESSNLKESKISLEGSIPKKEKKSSSLPKIAPKNSPPQVRSKDKLRNRSAGSSQLLPKLEKNSFEKRRIDQSSEDRKKIKDVLRKNYQLPSSLGKHTGKNKKPVSIIVESSLEEKFSPSPEGGIHGESGPRF